ncbi:MAG: DegV family EDD domain-containing protein [Lachnospiraceae bacterium]|nr:DegV family EDD domain-containing protein [Lachnospiraceae bacterium]
MIKFITDSSSDLFNLMGQSLATVPLSIATDEREYIDDENLDNHEMLDYMLSYKGKSRTSCPPVDAWIQAFDHAEAFDFGAAKLGAFGSAEAAGLGGVGSAGAAGAALYGAAGADGAAAISDEGLEIYVVTLTSGLSGTYNSACLAKDMYLEDHPDAKILVIDSLSVGPEIRLIIEKMVSLKACGKTFEEVSEEILAYQKKTRLYFGFTSIHNLVMNGRVSKIAGAAVSALNMTVMGTASPEGTIATGRKARGKKKVIRGFLEDLREANYTSGKIYITHVENEEFAQEVKRAILSEYPAAVIETYPTRGLVSYYGERGGIVLACE